MQNNTLAYHKEHNEDNNFIKCPSCFRQGITEVVLRYKCQTCNTLIVNCVFCCVRFCNFCSEESCRIREENPIKLTSFKVLYRQDGTNSTIIKYNDGTVDEIEDLK